MKKAITLLSTVLLFSCKGKTDNAQNKQAELKKDSLIQYMVDTDFLKNVPGWLKEYNVPAVGIGLIENGTIKKIEVFGELEYGIPAPENTIFNVASVTKTIGAILTLKLVHNGQWDLDEPLYHYWVDPDVVNDTLHKKLTTRHVLTHQTGFVNWRDGHPTGKLTFDWEPGTKHRYSGEGFAYLQNALERKFGKPIEEMTDSLIYKPLGMKDTHHAWTETTDEQRFALWHDVDGQKYDISYKTYLACLDDDLTTTVEDYCKFGIYVINHAGLSTNLFNSMVTSSANIKEHGRVGLGWFTFKDLLNKEYGIHHGGRDYGVKTEVIFLPKSKRGIVIFTNGDNGDSLIANIIREALDNGDEILEYLY